MSEVFTLTVHLTVDKDADQFKDIFAADLTDADGPFIGDYGPDAWGGYEGPKVAKVKVLDGFHLLKEWTSPNV